MKFSSKSPAKTIKQHSTYSPNQGKKKVTHNYIEKSLVNKKVEYWKFKYMKLEQFCQGKQSYEKLENELQIWKFKYQQLTLRARVAKGSDLIIQEYQSIIQELNQQFNSTNYNSSITFSPQKFNELQNKIDQQQNEIKSLQNQLEDFKQQSKQHTKHDYVTTTNNSNYQSFNQSANTQTLNQQYIQQNIRLELELKNFDQENKSLQEQIFFFQHNLEGQQKIIDQQKLHINQLEQNLASEKLKQLKSMDHNTINSKDQRNQKILMYRQIFIQNVKFWIVIFMDFTPFILEITYFNFILILAVFIFKFIFQILVKNKLLKTLSPTLKQKEQLIIIIVQKNISDETFIQIK